MKKNFKNNNEEILKNILKKSEEYIKHNSKEKTDSLKLEKIKEEYNKKINEVVDKKKKILKAIEIKESQISINSSKFNNYHIEKIANFSIINKSNISTLTQKSNEILNFSLLSKSNIQTDASDLPEKPKGLNNLALNDYINSLLQCFYHIKGLRKSFINPLKYDSKKQKVCHFLSQVTEGLTLGKNNDYSPKNFKEILGSINPSFSGVKGKDIIDLYRTVVNSIIDEIPYEYKEGEDYENKKQSYEDAKKNVVDEDYEYKKQSYEEAKKDVDPNNPINREFNYFYETIYII
jgi:ubiquitin C-terminal hydrolase